MPASQRSSMGATPYQDGAGAGTTFRVWAPFAQKVFVAGEFNKWLTDANPLFSENNDFWSVDVAGAGVGQQYKFVVVDAAGNPLWRMDPYASSIARNAQGVLNGLIVSANEVYSDQGYSTPPWNELVIYELHLATFTQGGAINGKGSFDTAVAKLSYLQSIAIPRPHSSATQLV